MGVVFGEPTDTPGSGKGTCQCQLLFFAFLRFCKNKTAENPKLKFRNMAHPGLKSAWETTKQFFASFGVCHLKNITDSARNKQMLNRLERNGYRCSLHRARQYMFEALPITWHSLEAPAHAHASSCRCMSLPVAGVGVHEWRRPLAYPHTILQCLGLSPSSAFHPAPC